jgi:hypothetical protein
MTNKKDSIAPLFNVNEEVSVRAWWTRPRGQPVLCKILEAYPGSKEYYSQRTPGYTVRPLSGYAHARMIREEHIVSPRGDERYASLSPESRTP